MCALMLAVCKPHIPHHPPPPPPPQLHWNKDRALRREVALGANTDITLTLIEPATGRAEHLLPLKLSGRATFSRYSVTPARGLHFGPVTYNTTSAPRVFEIVNLGEFPFTVKLFPLGKPPKPPPDADAAAPAGKGGKGAAKGVAGGSAASATAAAAKKAAAAARAAEAANALTLGQFVFEPSEATIQPGGKQEVSVVFRAEGAATYSATAGIAVSERDFADHPEGLPYEVAGESCIPGETLGGF
jgi:hydrocephalus-inducing protein